MVNEAGASIYSTSEVGREELPDLSPAVRSAVSIGRRLQDPMSELVKISPANIGVGMYQHDVKAKHLGESLEEVVQFCVNRVGVDANTASPSLLSYVSGLNALTARRLVEHRKENGEFKNRSQLKEVSGVGDATFVQVAGFLRISGGDSPLDSTSIHPESYPIAEEIIKRVNATAQELFPQEVCAVAAPPATPAPEKTAAPAATETPAETAAPSGETAAPKTDSAEASAEPETKSATESPVAETPAPEHAAEKSPAAETAAPEKAAAPAETKAVPVPPPSRAKAVA